MMKLIHAGLMSAVMVVMMCGGVFAQDCFNSQGGVVVPVVSIFAHSHNFLGTKLAISNISGSTVQCRVSVYDHDGNSVTHMGKVYTGANGGSWEVLSTGVGEFEIPAHSSRVFDFSQRSGASKRVTGYATIEWKSDDSMLRNALIGEVRGFGEGGTGVGYGGRYPINNGQPF